MKSMSPPGRSEEMQCGSPECSSRYSLISSSAEESGYSSIPSSGISLRSLRDTSLSPKDVRKRLFDSGVNSSTPDVTRKERSSRRVSGRCLIPTIIVEEEVDSRGSEQSTNENEEFVHGFSISTKSLRWKLSCTPSPKKYHPYSRDFSRGKLCHNAAQALSQKTRTPRRKGSLHSSPITKFPSFSELPEYRNPRRPRYGAQYVDFLWCLGKERTIAPALSLVLSSLSGEDLMACSAVSQTWRALIMSDRTANSRRLAAIEKRKLRKENMSQIPSKDRVAFLKENRSVLGVIQKERLFPPEGSILKTPPPKSPKTLKFELYMKEGLRVDGNEFQHLKPCPHCSFPSLVDAKLNVGVCSRLGCQFRFCTLCHCLEHTMPINSHSASPPRYMACPFAPKASSPPSPPRPMLLATRRQLNLAASKRSLRNLRRL